MPTTIAPATLDAPTLRAAHEDGLTYADYLTTGTADQQRHWTRVYDQAGLSDAQQLTLNEFTRQMRVIGVSGIWCGDCVQQCPLIQRIAEGSEAIDLRWVDRDEQAALAGAVRINAGHRVPVLIFCAEDYELVGWYGDRSLSRYRSLAARTLGAACPLPGAPLADDEVAATLQDWLDEFERVQWLLRLSTRLREKHGD